MLDPDAIGRYLDGRPQHLARLLKAIDATADPSRRRAGVSAAVRSLPRPLPSELLEWYRRLCDVTGRREVRGVGDLSGYAELDTKRLETLRSRYGVDLVVVRREHAERLRALARVYENAEYVVLRAATP